LDADTRASVETSLEILEVDRLGVRTERLERHRLLHVRAAQLAHPHVNRHLPALEARPLLGARARTVALLPATGRLAGTGPFAATDPLARPPRTGGRLQVVQADAIGAPALVVL